MAVADRLTESYDRLLLALEQLLVEAQRVGDAGVRERASLAMLDAIDFAEELGMIWDDDAERRRAAVGEALGDLDEMDDVAARLAGLRRGGPAM